MTIAPWPARVPRQPVVPARAGDARPVLGRLTFYVGALKALRHRATDMNTLIAVGTSAAYGYSVATILFPAFFIAAGLGMEGEALPLYFDTSAAIITLILLGRFLEARARSHTSDAIRKLIGLAPADSAGDPRRRRAGHRHRARSSRATSFVFGPARRSPVDGVRDATAPRRVDESMITGESMPVGKRPGTRSSAAPSTRSGHFTFRATRVGADTVLAQIVRLVQRRRARGRPIQRLADIVTGLLRAGRPGARGPHVRRLVRLRAGARVQPGPAQHGRGPDHRLPLRARPGDPDLDHGRHRQGRRERRPLPQRRGARAARTRSGRSSSTRPAPSPRASRA